MTVTEAFKEIEQTVKDGYINWIDYMLYLEKTLNDPNEERRLVAEQRILHCGESQRFWRTNPQPRLKLLNKPNE